jgi:hypothetical protein
VTRRVEVEINDESWSRLEALYDYSESNGLHFAEIVNCCLNAGVDRLYNEMMEGKL